MIKNWRPISLINVDSRIASKAVVTRMKKAIHSLTSYDQTTYVKEKYIGESVRLIDDLLKYAEDENGNGILFAADIKKVSDNLIYASLKRFLFGKDFV